MCPGDQLPSCCCCYYSRCSSCCCCCCCCRFCQQCGRFHPLTDFNGDRTSSYKPLKTAAAAAAAATAAAVGAATVTGSVSNAVASNPSQTSKGTANPVTRPSKRTMRAGARSIQRAMLLCMSWTGGCGGRAAAGAHPLMRNCPSRSLRMHVWHGDQRTGAAALPDS
jgi:hypothetical protein